MIETERLILRPWRQNEAHILFKYASDPAVGPIAGWAPHTSPEESLEIIRTVFSAPEVYAVVLKSTGEPVGCCGLMFADGLPATEAEIGYWIGTPFWGQGLIPEAVDALLARCFHDLKLSAVWCSHNNANHNSQRVCEKCGFTHHHTARDVISPLGDLRTELFYVMTAAQYNARQ